MNEAVAAQSLRRYGTAFPVTYREHVDAASAVEDVQRCEVRGGAVPFVVVGHRAGAALLIGRPGWVRSSAWIWLFSSTDSTMAWAGGST